MLTSPNNIREWGKRIATLIGAARVEMVSAREDYCPETASPHPRSRQQAILLSAAKHASASTKLEEACVLLREIVG